MSIGKNLTTEEIVFLQSLNDSDLARVLSELPKDQQSEILLSLSKTNPSKSAAERAKESKRAYEQRRSTAGQEIGLPTAEPADFALRSRCDESLRVFLETCFPDAFPLAWSDDHIRLIDKIDRAATDGGLSALAMPRGSGKTTIVMRAGIWAMLTGRRRFVTIVAATDKAAQKLLKGVKTELSYKDVLANMYPRELHAIRSLKGESKKAQGQLCQGVRTGVELLGDRISLGYVPGVATSEATLSICGLTGNIRGQQTTTQSAGVIRPDLVLIDDPQTKESAKSPSQCEERHSIMMGDVLGMSGPTTKMAGLCTCTVIYKDDLADRLLDRTKSPDWQGEKCKMVYEWPANQELWDEYRTIRESELREDGDGSKCNEFVAANFDKMHKGSRVGWEARKDPSDLSALQYAYNLRFRDEPAFFAEYQNEPLTSATEIPFDLKADEIAARIVPYKRNVVPDGCEKIVAFVDVQKDLLFYCVSAWTPGGRGHVIDYGTYPDQQRLYFSKRDISKTLAKVSSADGLNESLYFGLEQLTGQLLSRTFHREDGAQMQMNRLGVDARWGFSTRVVRRFCRETPHSGRINPMLGQYVGANSKPWHRWATQANERNGVHLRIQPPPKNERGVREILVDTNWWKSFAAERMLTNKGADQSIVLFAAKPHEHRMFAEHCSAEEPVLCESKIGQKVVEWKQSHSGLDNDFWDCLVGTCVLASVEGVRVHLEKPTSPPRQQKPQRPSAASTNKRPDGRSFFVTAR